jgi:membrane dipeptidase
MRIFALFALLLFAPPALLCAQTAKPSAYKMTPKTPSTTAPLIIDTHADTPGRMVDENYDLASPLGGGQLNLDAIHKGNLGAEFFSIWVDPDQFKGQYSHRALEMIDAVKQQVARHPDQMEFVTTPAGILQAHREHKFAALMGIEGGHTIEDSIPLLRQFYALGVRYMTLTWSNSNGWADSSGDIDDKSIPHTKEGLNEFGKDVVYEMNRLGMMVDISHVSDRTFFRTLVISRAPVIASHSGARALCDAPRNMTDDMLRAVARSGGPDSQGGVVQVNFYSGFLSQDYRNAQKAIEPEMNKAVQALKDQAKAAGKPVPYAEIDRLQRQFADRIPRPPFSILIDHIDHIAKVAGIDHVGLGSDFDGINGQLPQGIDSAADLPKIAAALRERGYSEADIQKIEGGNLLRVFREVEQVSKQLQAEERPRIREKQPFDEWQK